MKLSSQQQGTSWKYLYERLGEKRFQQLCNALLALEFPGVTCFPIGQRDGGRDAVRKSAGGSVIYQVKWTSKRLQSPVTWLDGAIKDEAENIERLVADGAEAYYLMTCVAGTSTRDRGTMDRLDKLLTGHSKHFGIPMQCWWQADIDARVDAAPKELKWAYADMLAGQDLVRYLIEADTIEARDQELHALLLKVIATQWHEDSKVKFKQVELDSHDLTDLFVDVEAKRTARPRAADQLMSSQSELAFLGGAAQYLLTARQPLTFVRGEPGQGKSTLGQYLCQVHRAEYLKKDKYLGCRRPELSVEEPRLPLRIDLRDYALWLTGGDPFADTDPTQPPARRLRKPCSLESFLAYLLEVRSGGVATSIATVQDILHRFPILVVLDGLDEVARDETRSRVVKEINEFAARLGTSMSAPQLVVTTRPNAAGLAEPSADKFETISLVRLSPNLRTKYLRKWADAQSVRGRERRALERTFRNRSAEPHIAQLADNPMQLTILLYLMQKRGDSVPTARTDLYTSYMETFLDREAAKSPAVHEHREDLEEVTAYLGWHLQTLAEARGTNGQLPTKAVRRAILDYLFDVEKNTSLVDDLFTAVTDRVWALTSKVQGTFEFDVQPVREYFAARYLYEFAGADVRGFDKSMVLRHLVRRSYWLNTSRFYAGFANPNELAGLVEGLEEEFEGGWHPGQVRAAAWALLADGVFSARIRSQRRAASLFTDDLSIRLISHALRTDATMVPLAFDRGGQTLVEALEEQMASDPLSPLNGERLSLAARLLPDRSAFDAWWLPRVQQAIGSEFEVAWLRTGSAFQAANRLPQEQVDGLSLLGVEAAEIALDAGVAPSPDSDLEKHLVQAVLDGQCSESETTTSSFASDLVRLFAPQHFLRKATGNENAFPTNVGHVDAVIPNHQRQANLQRLKSRDPRFERIQKAMRFGKGQSGTTSPWGNTARELSAIFGACWLAAEIALIAAASRHDQWNTGGDLTAASEPLGPQADYGRLLQDVRLNRANDAWWNGRFEAHDDPLSRGTWALALTAVATEQVVTQSLGLLDQAVLALPADASRVLRLSSSRLGASGIGRRLGPDVLQRAATLSSTTALLVAHHVAELDQPRDLPCLSETQLVEMAAYGVSAWPACRALTARMLASPSDSLLTALRAYGPAATVQVSGDSAKVPGTLMRAILEDAASYPLAWLLAAEQAVSQDSAEPHLAQAAESEGWFTH